MGDFLKKIDWEKEIFSFRFSLLGVLVFAFVWVYGFFGALSVGGLFKNIIFSLVLLAFFLPLLFLWKQKNEIFETEITLYRKDIFSSGIIFLFLFLFSRFSLGLSLVNDGFAHAQQALSHSFAGVYMLSSFFQFLQTLPFASVAWALNICLFLFGVFLIILLRKKSFLFTIVGSIALFLAFRFVIIQFGGSGGVHPPFRLFPLWFSSVFFSPSDFAFRFAQFLGLALGGWLLARVTEKKLGFPLSLLFTLAVLTVPVLWHTGVIVEQSLWSALAGIFVLVILWIKKEITPKIYATLITLVSIATMMRQSAFIALLPVLVFLGWDVWEKKITKKTVLIILSPFLFATPFLLHSFIAGTSATYIPGEEAFIPVGASAFTRVWFAIRSGMAWTAITNSVEMAWVLFAGFAFFSTLRTPRRLVALFALLSAGLFIFYSIRPGLWGIGRYQAEYVVPFSVLGLFILVSSIARGSRFVRGVLPVVLCMLVVSNVFIFTRIPEINDSVEELVPSFTKKIKEKNEYTILSEFPYAYHEALTTAREAGYADNVYIAGSTYGILPEILAGFTVREISAIRQAQGSDFLRNNTAALSPEAIHENMHIQLVLISDIQDKKEFSADLRARGWKPWKSFPNERYRSEIVGLVRL